MPSPLASHWTLDPEIAFLNHGSFGACPKPVLLAQQRFREQMEREPVRFFLRELEPLVDGVRRDLAAFLGADPEGLVFVTNATMGVNAVLQSFDLRAGDEVLTTTHAYGACKNALVHAAERTGATVTIAEVPFPVASEDEVVQCLLAKTTKRTRLALVDHVTSPTGIILPIERIVRELEARGVDILIDGAHAPGMLPLALRDLGAAYYTGNLHKWVCAPKGVGFLYVREDRRKSVRPTVISHGATSPRCDRSRLLLEFDWMGTFDPSALLAVPEALGFLPRLAGDWPSVYAANRTLALAARALLSNALGASPPAPESMIGSLAAVVIPGEAEGNAPPPLDTDPLQAALYDRFRVEVPIVPWKWPRRLVRVSAQLYNEIGDYERLVTGLRALL